jgi:hypothetical protein
MARRRDSVAGPFEDDEMNLRGAVRASVWIVVAGLSVAGAVLTAQTETGAKRVAETTAQIPQLSRSVLSLFGAPKGPRAAEAAPAVDPQTRQLTEAVQSLAADRDRLVARLEAIEHRGDVTGSTVAPSAAPATAEVKAGFGIDIGGERTPDALRTRWTTIKAKQGRYFDGLQPIMAVREGAKAGEVEFRLVAGPLPSAAAAARWCAALAETLTACRPAPFDGQRLIAN